MGGIERISALVISWQQAGQGFQDLADFGVAVIVPVVVCLYGQIHDAIGNAAILCAFCKPALIPAFNLFVSVANQWRAGGAGPYALDYNVVLRIMYRMELDRDEYDRLFEDIRTMEAAALDATGH